MGILYDLPLKGVNREGKSRKTLMSFISLVNCKCNLISTKASGVAEMVVDNTALVQHLRIEHTNLINYKNFIAKCSTI